jgi:hypothetical protein
MIMKRKMSVTARVWKDIPLEKGVFIHSLTNLLNDHIDLSCYGKGVTEFNFTAVIEPDSFFPNKFRYQKESSKIDVERRIPYEEVIDSQLGAFRVQVARLYLDVISELIEQDISEFDAKRFRQDVEDLFENQGWLAYA